MNTDRRVVPALHVSAVLAEDTVGERTREVHKTLQNSPHTLHKVAEKWMSHDNMNPLSRVIFKNIEKVPQKKISPIDKDSGHEAHHGHERKSGMSSFISMGHWCGQRGQHLFGMLGRFLGEIVGYLFQSLVIIMMFGPTRTGLLVIILGYLINVFSGAAIPLIATGGAALIIHLIFYGIGKIGGGGGDGGHGGGSENSHH